MLCGFGKKAVITFFNALFFNFEKFLLVTEERNPVLVLTPRNRVCSKFNSDFASLQCLHWNDYFWEGDKCSVSSVLYNPSTDATGIICQCSVAVGYFA